MSLVDEEFEPSSGVINEFKSFLVKSKKDKEKQLDKNLSKLLNMHLKPNTNSVTSSANPNKSALSPRKDFHRDYQRDQSKAEKVNNLLHNLKKKMRLHKNTRDVRFESKMKDFHNIYSFFDVRKFLENINLVNKESDVNSYLNMLQKDGSLSNSINTMILRDLSLEEDSEYENSKEFLLKKRGERVLERANTSLQEASLMRREKQERLRFDMTQHLIEKEKGLIDMELDTKDPMFDELLLHRIKKGKLVSQIEEKKKLTYYDPAKEKAQISELEKVIKAEMGFLNGKDFNEEVMEGRYYEFFKQQANKIRKMLTKASKNIYNKKVEKIDLITKEENTKIDTIRPRKMRVVKRSSEQSIFTRTPKNINPVDPKVEMRQKQGIKKAFKRKIKSDHSQSTFNPDVNLDGNNNTNTTYNTINLSQAAPSQATVDFVPKKRYPKTISIDLDAAPNVFVTNNDIFENRKTPSPVPMLEMNKFSLPRLKKNIINLGANTHSRLFKKIKEKTEAKRETSVLKQKMDKFIDDLNTSHELHESEMKEHLKEIEELERESKEAGNTGKEPVVDSLRDFTGFKGPVKYIDISKLKNKGILY